MPIRHQGIVYHTARTRSASAILTSVTPCAGTSWLVRWLDLRKRIRISFRYWSLTLPYAAWITVCIRPDPRDLAMFSAGPEIAGFAARLSAHAADARTG